MKRIVLTLAAVAVLLAALPAQAKETVRRFTKQIPTGGVSLVDLDFSVGQVNVDAIDGPDVQLDVQLQCRSGSDSCREAAQKVRLVFSTDTGKLHVQIKDWPKFSHHGLEAVIRVQMPRTLPLTADLGVGQMEIAGLERDVKANIGVGQLTLTLPESAVATVRADTGVGEASLYAGGHHYDSAGLITRTLHWTQGTGTAKISADCGVGEVDVKLR
ncbi:MAG TPA: hypothetical protein VGK45_07000 [Thermoanaerobaculia bacterium]